MIKLKNDYCLKCAFFTGMCINPSSKYYEKKSDEIKDKKCIEFEINPSKL